MEGITWKILTYPGDAVYAEYNGNGIILRLNAHDAPVAVYLEPEVYMSLVEFAERIKKENQKE